MAVATMLAMMVFVIVIRMVMLVVVTVQEVRAEDQYGTQHDDDGCGERVRDVSGLRRQGGGE